MVKPYLWDFNVGIIPRILKFAFVFKTKSYFLYTDADS
jgi:hypothetical protein